MSTISIRNGVLSLDLYLVRDALIHASIWAVQNEFKSNEYRSTLLIVVSLVEDILFFFYGRVFFSVRMKYE